MFNSRITLPNDFFQPEKTSKKWFIKSNFTSFENRNRPTPETFPFGRASEIVKREVDNNFSDSMFSDEFDQLENEYKYSDERSFSKELPETFDFNVSTYHVSDEDMSKGWQSLPHPSYLCRKQKSKQKCQKLLGFEVDCHLQDIQKRVKELAEVQPGVRKTENGLFPSQTHFYKTISSKQVMENSYNFNLE